MMTLYEVLLVMVAQTQPIQPPIKDAYFDLSVPPPASWPRQGTIAPPTAGVPVGEILVFTIEKKVKLKWLTGEPFSYQEANVPYWPTAAAGLNGSLVVAGKRKNLNTVIELWVFNQPMPPESSNYSAAYGKTVLYDANQMGRRGVRFLNPILSPNGNQVLVHFADSNDVYQLDTSTAALTLVVSVQQQPGLSIHQWQGVFAVDHASAGYLYVYHADPNSGVLDHVVLLDTDRDGSIDSSLFVDPSGWGQGLGNPANWISVNNG